MFDELDKQLSELVTDTFGVRDTDGLLATATIQQEGLAPVKVAYSVVEGQSEGLAQGFKNHETLEQIAIRIKTEELDCLTLPLPIEKTKVSLAGDSRDWAFDARPSVYQPNMCTLYLARKPLIQQGKSRTRRGG